MKPLEIFRKNFKDIVSQLDKTYSQYLRLSNHLEIYSNDNLNLKDMEIYFKYKVPQEVTNTYGTMHGGAITTLVDEVTSIVITSFDRDNRNSVSVNLDVNFISPIKINSSVLLHCKVLKLGKTLSFSELDFLDLENNKILAKGSHTVAMLDNEKNKII